MDNNFTSSPSKQPPYPQDFVGMLIWSFTCFRGRANRKIYLLSMLILNILCAVILSYIGLNALETFAGKTIYILQIIASIAISLKRAQDMDYSWKWLLLMLIPIVNLYPLIKLAFSRGTIGPNQYGEDPLAYFD